MYALRALNRKKPRFSVASSLASPMPAWPMTSLRAAARYAMSCAATARPSHGNPLLLLETGGERGGETGGERETGAETGAETAAETGA